MLRSASRSAAQQGGPPAEPQPPERQKEALKVMGKLRATNHSGKRGAGCAHSTKDLEQDEEPSSAQQRAAKKKVRTSSKRYKGVKRASTRYRPGPGGAMCVVWWWKVLESRGRGGCATGG